jgi:hypothetical protein
MNPIIIEHFDTYEVKLIESPAIVSYQIKNANRRYKCRKLVMTRFRGLTGVV